MFHLGMLYNDIMNIMSGIRQMKQEQSGSERIIVYEKKLQINKIR